MSFLGVMVAGAFAWQAWRTAQIGTSPAPSVSRSEAAVSGVPDKSIAVLPFVDMSEKHDQEYFSDGLSEELIDHLSHNPNLKVIARTSSFAFKGKNEDMRTIATKLGVANLLEGSVRKAGTQLRITAQLIRATDGVHLWSQTYERQLKDIFKVQDEISTTVARELNVALGETSRPAAVDTTDIAAYNLILQGNYFYYRYGKGDVEKAITFYRQATVLEPGNALAWARIAEAYVELGAGGQLSLEKARSQGWPLCNVRWRLIAIWQGRTTCSAICIATWNWTGMRPRRNMNVPSPWTRAVSVTRMQDSTLPGLRRPGPVMWMH